MPTCSVLPRGRIDTARLAATRNESDVETAVERREMGRHVRRTRRRGATYFDCQVVDEGMRQRWEAAMRWCARERRRGGPEVVSER